jgi:hypothetical protein
MRAIPETRLENGPVTRVKFIADYVYETEGRGKGPRFKKGAVYDFPDDFAQRFIRRNVAERVNKAEPVTDKYLVEAAPKSEEHADDAPKKAASKPGDQDKREPGGGPQKVDPLTVGDFKKA